MKLVSRYSWILCVIVDGQFSFFTREIYKNYKCKKGAGFCLLIFPEILSLSKNIFGDTILKYVFDQVKYPQCLKVGIQLWFGIPKLKLRAFIYVARTSF